MFSKKIWTPMFVLNFRKQKKNFTSDSLSAIVVLMVEKRSSIGNIRPVRQQLYAAYLKKEFGASRKI